MLINPLGKKVNLAEQPLGHYLQQEEIVTDKP